MRKIAFDVLRKVIIDQKYANVALKNVDHPNVALITQLVYGTLQNYEYCKAHWQPFVSKPLKKDIEILLTLSVYQWIFIDKTPDYAIVNETIEIAKRLFDGRYQKVVNAVLRNVFLQPILSLPFDTNENIALMTSFPLWIINLWEKQYGKELMLDFALSSNEASTIYVKENPFVSLVEDDSHLEKTDVQGCFAVNRTFLSSRAFALGKYIVQDKNAQLVAHFVDAKPNDVILDACAAPGGKSVSMAIKMNNQGKIIALDVFEHRLQLIQQLIRKTKMDSIKPTLQDATKAHETFKEETFDGVLVDAPCSGLGVLKRKPEIKHFIKPSDLDQLVTLQQEILKSVALLVKVGGWLVYSTCTINKKENEKQSEYFLNKFPQYEKIEEKFINPKTSEADGFYMVKYKRTS